MTSSDRGGVPPREVRLPISDAYDRWAPSYDAYDNPIVFMARAALRAVIGNVVGKTVVEFGCGTGRNLAFFKQRGAVRLVGLDLSPGMLAQAKSLDSAFDLHLHDMMQAAPLADASFDHALFCLSLEHVADTAIPLREAFRVLRSGGLLTIVEIHPFLSLGGAKAHFRDDHEEVHMPTYPHQYPVYLSCFRELGAVFVSCREWRPTDIAGELPPKVLKRGQDMPLVLTFGLQKP
jgi:ubiquinone/menaquinone biosynthesis C-methylase UbiE